MLAVVMALLIHMVIAIFLIAENGVASLTWKLRLPMKLLPHVVLAVILVTEHSRASFAAELGIPMQLDLHVLFASLMCAEGLVASLALGPMAFKVNVGSIVVVVVELLVAFA